MNNTFKYEYFIASRVRNQHLVDELLSKLRALGKTVYWCMETDTYHENLSPEETMRDIESTVDWRSNEMIRFIFDKDIKALEDSEKLIMLLPLPEGKSVHMEAGIAYGKGKKCILIGKVEKIETLYLLFDEHYESIDEFIASIKKIEQN